MFASEFSCFLFIPKPPTYPTYLPIHHSVLQPWVSLGLLYNRSPRPLLPEESGPLTYSDKCEYTSVSQDESSPQPDILFL
jgi:hypothetical protein